MIGLCGAQRTGKSTLAEAFAQSAGIPYLATTASGVFEMLDLDPKVEYPFETRMMIQEVILQMFESQYEEMTRQSAFFIADRTPIDLASYALADVTRATLVGRPELALALGKYVQRCLKSTSRFFTLVVLVQPGIPLVEAPGKAAACPAYMDHLNDLQVGILQRDESIVRSIRIPRGMLDLQERKQFVASALGACAETQYVLKKSASFH